MASYLRRVQNISLQFLLFGLCYLVSVALSVPLNKTILNANSNHANQPQLPVQRMAGLQPNINAGVGNAGKLAPDLHKPNSGMNQHILLASHPDCQDDVARLCDTDALKKNNFAVLECLQADLAIQVYKFTIHILYQIVGYLNIFNVMGFCCLIFCKHNHCFGHMIFYLHTVQRYR